MNGKSFDKYVQECRSQNRETVNRMIEIGREKVKTEEGEKSTAKVFRVLEVLILIKLALYLELIDHGYFQFEGLFYYGLIMIEWLLVFWISLERI